MRVRKSLSAAAFVVVMDILGVGLVPAMSIMPQAAIAQTASSSSPATAIENLDSALLAVMKQGRQIPFQQRYATLAPAVEQALDLPGILRISVGFAWSSMSREQQQQLLAAFRKYTIATYLDNFDSFNGQKFVVEPQTRQLATGQNVVSTKIIPKNGSPHRLDYVMHRLPDGSWKAIDVLAEGTSRVAVQRSDWSALINQGGARALLATMHRKTQALEQG
ncbi:MAG: ABC transporter substrate-binding protein [Acetobacteraceae bacterium]|nr:ABC transporter substrate-binding protein [Acetobacteraceae bacterium]